MRSKIWKVESYLQSYPFSSGIGQALTDGKPTGKWILIFIVVLIIEILLSQYLGLIGTVINIIISLVFAYDAYANLIEI